MDPLQKLDADLAAEDARRGIPPDNPALANIDASLAAEDARRARQPAQFASTPSGAAIYSQPQMRRSAGLDQQGNSMEDFRRARQNFVYEAGGKATDLTGSPAVGAAVNQAADLATDPLTYAGGGVGKLLTPVMESGAKKVMWSALKPNQAARESGDASKAVQTLLEKGYNVSEGGVEGMTGVIDKLDAAVSQAIQNAGNVNVRNALQPLKDVFQRYKYGNERVTNYKAITDEIGKYLDHPEIRRALEMPATVAQKFKRALYGEVGDAGYGFGLKPAAGRDAKKGIASGLASELERVAPEVAPLNAEMGPTINARDLARDRVQVAQNRNPLGIGALFDPSKWPVWLLDRNELGKSMLAHVLHQGAPYAPAAAATISGAVGETVLKPRLEKELQ